MSRVLIRLKILTIETTIASIAYLESNYVTQMMIEAVEMIKLLIVLMKIVLCFDSKSVTFTTIAAVEMKRVLIALINKVVEDYNLNVPQYLIFDMSGVIQPTEDNDDFEEVYNDFNTTPIC